MSFFSKKDVLSKKVLLSVLAAGFISSFGIQSSAWAATSGSLPEAELIDGVYVINDSVDVAYIEVIDGNKLLLGGGGTVSGALLNDGYKSVTVTQKGSTLTANNVAFTGQVRLENDTFLNLLGSSAIYSKEEVIHDDQPADILLSVAQGAKIAFNSADKETVIKGHIELNGAELHTRGKVRVNGAIIAHEGSKVTINDGLLSEGCSVLGARKSNSHKALEVSGGSTVFANNVAFKGEITVSGESKVVLNGGSVTKSIMYGDESQKTLSSTNNGNTSGQEVEYTEIGVDDDKSYFEINGVNVNSNLGAFEGGKIVINGGGVDAIHGIYAGIRDNSDTETTTSVVELNGNPNNIFTCGEFLIADHGGKIYINGGTLKADNFRSLLKYADDGEEQTHTSDANGIVLDKNGVISTYSDQIFTYAAYKMNNGTETVSVDSGIVLVDVNTAVNFQAGTLQLNDAKYTLEYVKKASDNLKNADSGATKLVMTGQLVNSNGDKLSNVDIRNIANSDLSNIEFDKLTVKTSGNLVVGNDTDTLDNSTQNVDYGFSVGKLEFAAGSDSITLEGGREVTLGGTSGGDVVSVNDDNNAKVNVVVGTNSNGSNTNGTLNIGNSSVGEDVNLKLNGNVTVNKSSTLNTNGKVNITDGVSLSDATLDAAVGSVSTTKLEVGGNSNLLGYAEADDLTLSNNASAGNNVLNIGNDSGSGTLTIKNADLNGGTLFLDPEWKPGGTINDASGLAVTEATTLTGNYVVGRNSYLSLGADLATAKAVFAKTEETWGENDITAAAYIDSKVDVSTGSLVVNGSFTTAPSSYTNGSVVFADKSLLMVNGTNIQSQTAISGVSSATIDEGSKLYIDNAQEGVVYKISDSNLTAWSEKNIFSNNKLLKFSIIAGAGFSVSTSNLSMQEAYGNSLIAPHVFDAAMAAGGTANEFVNKAANAHNNSTDAAQISAFNSAAAMSELASVEHGTFAASNLFTDAVAEHMSLVDAKEHDKDVWAKYIHSRNNVDGLALAGNHTNYDATYNGIVVGSDIYKEGKGIIGGALTYIDGSIKGNTIAARTENDATYYGLSIYGGIQNEDSVVVGDISYLHGKNDITQRNSGMNLTADAKSDAFSIGVRAEKAIKSGVGKFVPYAGLRYMHLGAGNYSNSIGITYDGDDMNLWLLPIGVKYSADMQKGDWNIRPVVEIGYVWNMGERNANQTVSLNGASDGFGFDVADSGSYVGRIAVEAEKANTTYGLSYEYQKGDNVKTGKWTANISWTF